MKQYSVQIDTTFTKNFYVEANSEEEANEKAKQEAYDNHHGEVIIGAQIVNTYECDDEGYQK